ncbi:caspase family protein [Pseudonocardia oroxyli]|uniref:caspase family protein n=1 Tax=Pseudonocardia oroxyli TaxID=366584 RepID=UPI0015A34D66|nr:caspase family protein [Pseudonocardia oroxyli]
MLVGIDTYARPELALRGCVNDVRLAERTLTDRIPRGELSICTLLDQEATRGEIIRCFREHLGGAGPGGTALFWFSGHGSTGPLPPEIWYAESAGACQTTVCHDSRDTAPDLYDKELAVLVREIVATGARLVSVKDSCHARHGMRAPGMTPRLAPPARNPPRLVELLPELVRDTAGPDRPALGRQEPGHVALSACDEWEVAHETRTDDGVHGIFSLALTQALARLGPDATYRSVLADARCRVESRYRRQIPALEAVGSIADERFLDGTLRPRAATVTLRWLRGRWEVDLGAVHGLASGTRLGVPGVLPAREVRVVDVQVDRSTVEPVGWDPDPQQLYDVAVTDVPLPPVAVTATPEIATRLAAVLEARTSPHIRITTPREADAAPLLLRVRERSDGGILITSADGEELTSSCPSDADGLRHTIAGLEHIARWMQVRALHNPSPALADAVRLEIVPVPADGSVPPPDVAPLPAGTIELDYMWSGADWVAPTVHVRLRNTTDERLYCVLLDLTDRFRLHAELFPGQYVAAGGVADVGGGAPVRFGLPPKRDLEPGAFGTDWLLLLVSQRQFSSEPFFLPRLGEPPQAAPARHRGGLSGVLDRLGFRAVHRDAETTAVLAPHDWATSVVEVTTRVPDDWTTR